MKSEKNRLTRIIKTVNDKFPDGTNIFGYEGITKEKVIISLNNLYLLLGLIEAFEDEIETVWLKRRLAKRFDDAVALLKEIESEKWTDLFDKFLESITKMRIESKDVYITLSDNPLRNEKVLQEIKEHAGELSEALIDIDEKLKIIKNGSEESIKLTQDLATLKTELDSTTEKGSKILNNLFEIEKTANENNETIQGITPELASTFTQVKDIHKSAIINDEKIIKLIANLEEKISKTEQTQNVLNKQVESDGIIQEQIRQTLQDVNKHGMAGAFLKRKNELRLTVFLWGLLSVIAMGLLIFVSYKFATYIMSAGDFNLPKNLFKIPSVLAGVWLCWFCAKQFGYTIRIREDYSYKYAISMAFEGYKNETREINPELLEKLLEVTLANISTNPVILYNTKSNHGSPWHELTDGIKQFLNINVKAEVSANSTDLKGMLK